MSKIKTLAMAAAAALLVTSTAASAAITTFAQFVNNSGARNVRWQNNGTGSVASNGTGGRFYTTSSGSGTSPGNSRSLFMFEGGLAFLGFIPANFYMDITVASGNPAGVDGSNLYQLIPTGGFSFKTTSDLTVGSTTFLAGSNLLTGTFSNAYISGSGSSGFYGDSISSALVYTSDFLDFTGTTDRDFSMGLTSITSSLFRSTVGGAKALRTFRAFANGSFSSDPAPITVGIPEPEVWGLMVVGFGLVGLQVRRRNRPATVVA